MPSPTFLQVFDAQLDQYLEIDEDLAEKEATAAKLARNRRQVWNAERTKKLGEDPRANRTELRNSLQPGFYVSSFPNKRIRTAHRLGQCYIIPGLAYVRYEYAGSSMPSSGSFDLTCKWCSKSVGFDAFSGTDTSSLVEEAAA